MTEIFLLGIVLLAFLVQVNMFLWFRTKKGFNECQKANTLKVLTDVSEQR